MSNSSILIFIVAAIGCAIACWFVTSFRRKALKKFGYDFFTRDYVYALVFAAFVGGWGYRIWRYAPPHIVKERQLLWMTLIGIAALVVIVLACRNFAKTNFSYGTLGTILQVFVLPTMLLLTLLAVFGVALGSSLSVGGNSSNDDEDAYDAQAREHERWMNDPLNKDSPNYRFKNDKDGGY